MIRKFVAQWVTRSVSSDTGPPGDAHTSVAARDAVAAGADVAAAAVHDATATEGVVDGLLAESGGDEVHTKGRIRAKAADQGRGSELELVWRDPLDID